MPEIADNQLFDFIHNSFYFNLELINQGGIFTMRNDDGKTNYSLR